MLKMDTTEVISREVPLPKNRSMLFMAIYTNGRFTEYKVYTGNVRKVKGKRRVVGVKTLIHVTQIGGVVLREPSPEELNAIVEHDMFAEVL